MDLIDEEHSWNQLSNSLVNVAVDYLVDLSPEFLSDLCLFGLHDLAHQTHEVVAALRLGIGHV